MGIKERREREKEQRRIDIIDAAERIIFSKGIVAATMDQVAEEAELSKGTLYLYFKSKEDLYLAIVIRGEQILLNMFRTAVKDAKTGLDRVFAIGRAYYQFSSEYINYFNAMMYFEWTDINRAIEQNPNGLACSDLSDDIFAEVSNAIKIGIEDGSIQEDIDPYYGAFVLWAQTTGLFQIASTKKNHLQKFHNIEAEKLVSIALEMSYRALSKK